MEDMLAELGLPPMRTLREHLFDCKELKQVFAGIPQPLAFERRAEVCVPTPRDCWRTSCAQQFVPHRQENGSAEQESSTLI